MRQDRSDAAKVRGRRARKAESQPPCCLVSKLQPRATTLARSLPMHPEGGIIGVGCVPIKPDARFRLGRFDEARGKETVHSAPFGGIELEVIGKRPEATRGFAPCCLAEKLRFFNRLKGHGRVPHEQGSNLRLAFLGLERAG